MRKPVFIIFLALHINGHFERSKFAGTPSAFKSIPGRVYLYGELEFLRRYLRSARIATRPTCRANRKIFKDLKQLCFSEVSSRWRQDMIKVVWRVTVGGCRCGSRQTRANVFRLAATVEAMMSRSRLREVFLTKQLDERSYYKWRRFGQKLTSTFLR